VSRASITTTLKVDDKATPAIKNIIGQMSAYQKQHAEAIKQIDKQNIASARSEKTAATLVKEAQQEKTDAILKIQNTIALMTRKEKIQYNKKIEDIKAEGNKEQELLGKDLRYTTVYYNTKIAKAKEAQQKLKSINKSNLVPLVRDKNLASSNFGSTAMQLETQAKKEADAHKKIAKAKDKNTKSTDHLANATIRYLRWAGTIVGVLYAVERAWRVTTGAGIEMNKMVENNTYGIAALVSANTRMVDSYGNTLTPMQKFVAGQKIAKERMKELRVEAMKTPATFKQITDIFQQAIGQTMGMGNAFGATVDEIGKNTVELSSRFAQVAGAIGMPMDRVKEEIRSALTGNVSTDSIISTMLFGSPTKANAAIRKARQSANGLKDLFDSVFKSFDILSTTRTFDKGLNQMKGAWEIAMGDMVAKSGMFKDITNTFYTMSQDIIDNTDEIVKRFDNFYKTLKKVAPVIEKITEAFLIYKAVGIASTIWKSVAAFTAEQLIIDATTGAVTRLTASQKLLNATILKNPYVIAVAAAGIGLNYLIDKTNELHDATKKTIEDVQSQNVNLLGTKEQLTQELAQKEKMLKVWTEKLAKDKKKYGKDSNIFGIDKAQVEGITQAVKKLNEQLDGTTARKEKAQKALESAKKQIILLTKAGINYKLYNNAQKELLKSLSEEVKLQKEIKKYTDGILVNKKLLAVEEARPKPEKNLIANIKKVIATEEKIVKQKQDKISKIKQDALDKEDAKYQSFNNKMRSINNKAYVEVQRQLNKEKTDKKKAYDSMFQTKKEYLNIIGTEEEKAQAQIASTMSKLGEDGTLTAKQLKKAFAKLNQEHILSINADALSLISNPLDTLNAKFIKMYENIKRLTGEDAWSPEQLQKFFNVWQKSAEDIGKQNKKQSKYELIGSSMWTAGLKGQAKSIANIGNAIGDLGKDQAKWNALVKAGGDDEAKKNIHLNNQFALYGNIAGAMSNMFEEGSKGAEASKIAQASLAIVGGAAAIINQGKGDPYTAIARMAAMAATVAGVLGNAGISGGGGISAESGYQNTIKQNKEDIKLSYEPITNRLDQQIALLDSINRNGSSAELKNSEASISFARDYALWKEDVFSGSRLSPAPSKLGDKDWQNISNWESNLGIDVWSNPSGNDIQLNTDVLRQGNNLIDVIRNLLDTKFYAGTLGQNATNTTGDQQDQLAWLDKMISELQGKINDWAISTIDSMNKLTDASRDFQDSFDKLTDSTYYADKTLRNSFSQVDKLRGDTTLPDYLHGLVDSIQTTNDFLTDDRFNLLLSKDPADIEAQTKLLKEFGDVTGHVFENGASEALDYIDSIKKVTDAMSTSNTNINSFIDSFRTDQQKAEYQASKLGVNLATDMNGLSLLFKQLSSDTFGLTDADLSLLQANKDLINSGLDDYINKINDNVSTLNGVIDSLSGVIEKLKGSTAGAGYSLTHFYELMSKTQQLSNSTDYKAFSDSVSDTINASSVLFDTANFQTARDQLFAQAVAQNQFDSLEVHTLTQIDYLKEIEANTRESNAHLIDMLTALSQDVQKQYTNSNAAVVDSAYLTYLNRDAEAAGSTYWQNQLSSGSVATTSIGLAVATAGAVNGEISRADYVTDLYTQGLGRTPTQAEVDYWTNDSQTSTADLANNFAELDLNFHAFADGGIVTKPTLGLIGEAGYPEAVIRFKDPRDPLQTKELIQAIKDLTNIVIQQADDGRETRKLSEDQLATLLDIEEKIA